MNIQELKSAIAKVESIRDKAQELTKSQARNFYSINDYASHAREAIVFVDHGNRDRFWLPQHDALGALDKPLEDDEKKFDSAFLTLKNRLMRILNSYIWDMEKGFQEHEKEQSLNQRYNG